MEGNKNTEMFTVRRWNHLWRLENKKLYICFIIFIIFIFII